MGPSAEAARILSPEEWADEQARKKGKRPGEPVVTVGKPVGVGVPKSELDRLANAPELATRISTRLALLRQPKGYVTEGRKAGTVETAADIALSNVVAPFSDAMAEAGTEGALSRYGGDASKHANLFGAAGALGAVAGNVGVSGTVLPKTGLSVGKRVLATAAEGAAQNAGLATAGGLVEGEDAGTIAKRAGAGALIGAGLGGSMAALHGAPELTRAVRSRLEQLRPARGGITAPGAGAPTSRLEQLRRARTDGAGERATPASAEAPALKKKEYDYSSTQLDLPPEHAQAIQQLAAKIPDEHLAEHGREDAPHITVKYGLHGNEPEKVRALLADEPPITVTLGKTSHFPDSGSGDVVKVDIDSPQLHALNKKIADALPHTDTHPEYTPHATVAYVKKGLGKQYAGDASLEGQTITLDRLTFSGKDGQQVEIPLGGKDASGAADPLAPDVTPKAASPYAASRQGVTTLYHGTSPETALRMALGSEDKAGLFVTPREELALGQGGKGAVIEFANTDRIDVERHVKPGSELSAQQTGEWPEFRVAKMPHEGGDVVRSVTLAAGAKVPPYLVRRAEALGWTRHTLDDGRVQFRNPTIGDAAPRASSAEPAADGPVLSPQQFRQRRAGAIDPRVMATVATTGAGAAAGAAADDEDRLRGAMLGGAAGAVAGVGGARLLSRLAQDVRGADGVPGQANRPGFLGLGRRRGDPRLMRTEPEGASYAAPLDDGKDPRLVDMAKLGLSPEGEQTYRGILGQLDLKKKRIGHAEQYAEAERRATDPMALARHQGQWDGMDALGARVFQSQATERIVALSKDLTAGVKTPDETNAIQSEIARLTDDISILAGRSAKERTAAGRNLNAYKIVARSTMDDATWQTLAQRAKGTLPLTTDEVLKVRTLTGRRDREGLVGFVGSLHRSSPLDKGLALWKAGLLTAPTTHLANTVSNLTMAVLETAKEPLALGIDAIISLARGTERTKAYPVRGLVGSQLRAFGPGLREAMRVFRTGVTPEQAAKWDFSRTNFDNAFFQAYTDAVFNSLAAEDRPFRAMAVARALGEHVNIRVRQLRRADPTLDIAAETRRLMQQPPNDLMVQAIADAEIAVFQNRGVLAKAASGMKKDLRGGARAAVEVTLPFTQTPSNIASRLVDYSPLGVLSAAVRQTYNGGQKRLAEDLARTLTGSGLVAVGFMLARDGAASGASPTQADERSQWELEGKQANSVRVNGHWVNISRLSPAGMLVALGAQFYNVTANGHSSVSDKVGGLVGSAGRVVTDQSFLRGLSGSLDVVNDPVRYGGDFVDNLGKSVVPSAVGRVATMVDPAQREAHSLVEGIQSRVPFASRALPQKLDAFGRPLTRSHSALSLVDFLNTTEAHGGPVLSEMDRLGVTVGKARKTRTVRGEPVEYTPDEQRALLAEMGPARAARLARVITSPAYFAASDDSKRHRLRDAIDMEGARAYARDDRRRRPAKQQDYVDDTEP